MPADPKPRKEDRLRVKEEQKGALKAYRRTQVAAAIDRDGDLCTVCYFIDNRIIPRQEVHHVYSRGKKSGDWREHYTNLLCVCREHHPLPIQTPGANEDLAWVEAVLKMANQTPINPNFKEPK